MPAIVFVFKMAATLEFSMSHTSANIIDRKLIIVYIAIVFVFKMAATLEV